jgi:hypothetical protein
LQVKVDNRKASDVDISNITVHSLGIACMHHFLNVEGFRFWQPFELYFVPVSILKFSLTSVAFLPHKSQQLDFVQDIVFEYV